MSGDAPIIERHVCGCVCGTAPVSQATTFEDPRDQLIEDLRQSAMLGREAWATVALHELATWGVIIYHTWGHLTEEEWEAFGKMSRTTARKTLEMPR